MATSFPSLPPSPPPACTRHMTGDTDWQLCLVDPRQDDGPIREETWLKRRQCQSDNHGFIVKSTVGSGSGINRAPLSNVIRGSIGETSTRGI